MSSIYYASTYMEIWGNPHLKPYSTYETNLMWTIKSRHTLMAFAEFQPNYSVQLPYQTTDHLAVIMKETNFDYNHTIGIRASTTFGIGNWMNGSVSQQESTDMTRVTISLTCPSIANISLPFLPEIYPSSLAEAITSISYLTHSISRKPFKDSMTSNQSFS